MCPDFVQGRSNYEQIVAVEKRRAVTVSVAVIMSVFSVFASVASGVRRSCPLWALVLVSVSGDSECRRFVRDMSIPALPSWGPRVSRGLSRSFGSPVGGVSSVV